MRLSRVKTGSSVISARCYCLFRCTASSGVSPSPLMARAQKVGQALSVGKGIPCGLVQSGIHSWSSIPASKALSSTSGSPYAIANVSKRHQHSQAQEATADIDHVHVIASYPEWIKPQDTLPRRHIGPSDEEITSMLKELKQPNLDVFIRQTIPDSIRASKEFTIPSEQTPEMEMLDELTKAGKANSAAEVDTYIGMGYHPTITPGVIKRNVLENPGWYTSYTPYQPEISQGMCSLVLANIRSSGEFVELSNSDYGTHWTSIGKCISPR
jgi:Glycine cleavage system P-protein